MQALPKPTEKTDAVRSYPKITIVTASFNQADYLEQCIDSILSQNYPNLEYIIMDGGSSDHSVEIIKKYQKYLSYWQSQPDGGPYQAVQAGFERSSGDIMGYLNSDDMLHPGGLEVLREVFSVRPDIEFVTGRRLGFKENGDQLSFGYETQRWSRKFLLARENIQEELLCVMQEATYFRRSLWQRAGAYIDTHYKYAADYELWARFTRYAQLYSVDAKIGGFRLRGTNQRSVDCAEKYTQECLKVIEREEEQTTGNSVLENEFPELITLPVKAGPAPIARLKKVNANAPRVASPRLDLPKISIVTPSYNQGEYLEECIDSILSQGNCNLEYVIMDGGSTDESVEIIKKYERHLKYWQSQPDGGHYAAINLGFAQTSGEIMCWLNADDKFRPDALATVSEVFCNRKEVEWITGVPSAWNKAGEEYWVFSRIPVYSRFQNIFHNFSDLWIQQESVFWRRSLWDKAGGFLDTRWKYAADLDLWRRYFRFTQLYSVSRILSGARTHPDQKSAIYLKRYMKEGLRVIHEEGELFRRGIFSETLPAAQPIMI